MIGVSFGTSGILATSRSPKNTWISAFDWSEYRQSRNSLASTWQPSSKGRLVAASMASMAASGAIRLRCFLRAASRAAAKIARVLLRRAQLLIALASLRSGLPRDLTREGHGTAQEIAVDQPIHDPGIERILRLDRISAGTHFNCLGDASQTRQTLRARCSWNQAELHFRLANLRTGRRHAVVTRHGQFQAAAERGAVNRHHHRLGAVFDLAADRGSKPGPGPPLDWVILTNSLMSAPATKVRPPPMTTAAITLHPFRLDRWLRKSLRAHPDSRRSPADY